MNFQESIDKAIPTAGEYGMLAPVHLGPVGEDIKMLHHKSEMVRQGENGVHIGFAGLANIDFALSSQAGGLVLCDFNRNQTKFWKELFNLVHTCPDAMTAQRVMQNLLRRDDQQTLQFAGADGPIDIRAGNLTSEIITQPWLRDNRKYQQLKALVDKGRVAAITLDCCDTDRAIQISDWLRENGLHASTLYVSNLRNCYAGDGDFYGRTVEEGARLLETSILALSSLGETVILDGAVALGKSSQWLR